MIENKTVLAIIPARGGSKRLPKKNVLDLAGRPLISWTISAAKNSKYVDRVVVSTDNDEIIRIAKHSMADVPFKRNAGLSSDTATTEDVIKDCLERLGEAYDVVVVLQPTSPLRTVEDIDTALEMMKDTEVQGIVSVVQLEHPLIWCNTLPEDRSMADFMKPEYIGMRSQDFPASYRINGAIYIYTLEKLYRSGMLLDKGVYAYVMPKERSVDIDERVDFMIADAILRLQV
ncbi:acylneuraminate cytidylyltransferase family protein [Shewanella sp. JM162201]|uniref:Acylneuraminate cytidylyltransferase family protein n=1 Tax=Shewanella jiangmenensis TaxID=2837387 RepID=A0ABS5UY75_9GAMM|nr:acylneuraminate cytidylyltransferase family protein [Shewanella jiangmenensis]MBT1443005.1 acylneuraminate cytidylyltransferase family protein [Shewanella jiangmenensis]